jgi:hypothetical protein
MKALILICASALSPATCNIDNATAVVQGPSGGGLATCGLHAQAYIAETAMSGYLDGEHFLKVVCSSRPLEDVLRTREARLEGPAGSRVD